MTDARVADSRADGNPPSAATTWALALAGFVALTLLVMWPALSDISNTIMGPHQPSDATSGGVWLAWQFAHTGIGQSSTPSLGYPYYGSLWTLTFLTALAWVAPLWGLAHVTTPVAAWNLTICLGFLVDAMITFGLVLWLTSRRWLAFAAGVLFAFSPFAVVQSHIHIGYVFDFVYPLILWAGLAWVSRPTAKRAVMFGVSVGAAAYVDGYYIVFAPLVAAVFVFLAVALAPAIPRPRRPLFASLPWAAAAGIIIALPLALILKTQTGTVATSLAVDRTRNAVDSSSATIGEYFIPFRTSPPWHWLLTSLFGSNVVLPNVTGPCVYLGLGSIALAIGAAIAFWRNPTIVEGLQLPPRFLVSMGVLGSVLLMLASFATLGPIPGFPRLLWSVEPFWRAFARLGEGAICFLVLAAVLGILTLTWSKQRWLAPLVACLAILDATYILPWASWSYAANAPPAIEWLARHQDGGAVAAYPMVPPPLPAYEYYVSFQVMDRHPLFNGAISSSLHARLERGLAAVTDPQTVPTLRTLGVRYVLVNPSQYIGAAGWPFSITGLSPVVTQGGVWLFRIEPGPRVPAAITVGTGFNVERQFLPRVERWMSGRTATLGFDNFLRPRRVEVRFRAVSYKVPRRMTVVQNGRVVWRGQVASEGTSVEFKVSSRSSLHLRVFPGAVHIPGWLTKRSVSIGEFRMHSLSPAGSTNEP